MDNLIDFSLWINNSATFGKPKPFQLENINLITIGNY